MMKSSLFTALRLRLDLRVGVVGVDLDAGLPLSSEALRLRDPREVDGSVAEEADLEALRLREADLSSATIVDLILPPSAPTTWNGRALGDYVLTASSNIVTLYNPWSQDSQPTRYSSTAIVQRNGGLQTV